MKQSTKIMLSGLFIALAIILPFVTGRIPHIGQMLCPMHIPVIICGFICGWQYGLIVGLICPILNFFIFGTPPVFPIGIAMMFELAAYGAFSGIFYNLFPKKMIFVYIDLILAMICGRLVWGTVMFLIARVSEIDFSMNVFLSTAVISATPAIIIQILFIPLLVQVARKNV